MEKKSINDLLGCSFLVPVYQRGYRWTKFNVSQLLNDILENIDKEYNLQVLVLCKKDGHNIIIDGQQRITTLFLINSYINSLVEEEQDNFIIEYESRKKSKEFLMFLSNIKDNSNLNWDSIWNEFKNYISEKSEEDIERIKENIDFRYMFQAYEAICEKLRNVSDFKNIKNHILNNCKFIVQYNKIEKEGDIQNIFNKLNIGKIYLTNSELIKSEYMNPKYYDDNYDSNILLISKAWSDIENTLRNPDFWAFIPHEDQYGVEISNNSEEESKEKSNSSKKVYKERNIFKSRIDEIFQLYLVYIYGGDINKYEKEFKEHCNSKYFIYEKIKEKILDGKADIGYEWGEIEKLFSNILELYESDGRDTKYMRLINEDEIRKSDTVNKEENRNNIYNLIAYLIYMYTDVQKKSVLEVEKLIIDLINEGRDCREKFLKDKIKKEFYEIYGINEENKIREALKQVEYIEGNNDNNKKIQNLFMLFNIILLQKNPAISNRYNFLSYRYWTIEHIYSQNEMKLIFENEMIKRKEEEIFRLKDEIEKIDKEIDAINKLYNKNIKKCKEKNEKIKDTKKSDVEEKYKKIEGYHNKEKTKKNDEKKEKEKNLKKKEEELTKVREILPIMRKEIIKSLVEYYEEYGEEGKKEQEIMNKINLINRLFDVLDNSKNLEDNYRDDDLIKKLLSRHTKNILEEFIQKIRYIDIDKEEFIEIVKADFKFENNLNLDNLKRLYEELEQVKIYSDDEKYQIYTQKENIYEKVKKELNDLYREYTLSKWENKKEIFTGEIEDYFKNAHNDYLSSNKICNLSLLRQKENKDIAREYLKKKEKISEFISSGTVIPYSTLLVFTDKYMDIRKINNGERWQWLWSSRTKYFNDILDNLMNFFK
ncbi:DUF262 domain-containing protein [Lachnoanaerobaculum gingivalis]|uniref:DUF262 domain-containing protein n=1 Tax=Lachnoanaerobaculum gingivalis TaxID=2490855 RepID=UPI0024A6987E|nr:DUF262 domain-containing protein [Lachnoanaerobaculum gingivalis]WHE87568.1 DUF262 domain-containing protein [Lachnoanaerobaculum gingivalis]